MSLVVRLDALEIRSIVVGQAAVHEKFGNERVLRDVGGANLLHVEIEPVLKLFLWWFGRELGWGSPRIARPSHRWINQGIGCLRSDSQFRVGEQSDLVAMDYAGVRLQDRGDGELEAQDVVE